MLRFNQILSYDLFFFRRLDFLIYSAPIPLPIPVGGAAPVPVPPIAGGVGGIGMWHNYINSKTNKHRAP